MGEGGFKVAEGKASNKPENERRINRNSHKETQAVTRRSTAQAGRDSSGRKSWKGEKKDEDGG
jgi:hypothetical protein